MCYTLTLEREEHLKTHLPKMHLKVILSFPRASFKRFPGEELVCFLKGAWQEIKWSNVTHFSTQESG
jgi:hypothetical protein